VSTDLTAIRTGNTSALKRNRFSVPSCELCKPKRRVKMKPTRHLISNYQLNAQFLYYITIYMLHYNPQHVSSSTMLIFRRTDFIITTSGIVTLCTRPYSTPIESGLSPLSTGILSARKLY